MGLKYLTVRHACHLSGVLKGLTDNLRGLPAKEGAKEVVVSLGGGELCGPSGRTGRIRSRANRGLTGWRLPMMQGREVLPMEGR